MFEGEKKVILDIGSFKEMVLLEKETLTSNKTFIKEGVSER